MRSLFRFNVVDDYNRECLAIEIDTNLPVSRLSEVRDITDEWIEQYNQERPLESLKT
jgi:transposase InsO family protein